MRIFWKALQTYFRAIPASDFYTAVSGNLFADIAPQGTAMPYAVISSSTGFPMYDLEGKADENLTVQIDLYADNESMIQDVFEAMKAQFDNCSFIVSGYQITGFKRVMNHKITEDEHRRYIVQYQVTIGV